MLAVGDSTRLEIIFSTGSYKNIVTKSPVILTNEGPQKITAKITVNIFANPDSTFPITIKPSKIAFPDTGATVITELYFSIANVSRQELRPTLVSSPKALVSVVLPKSIPAGGFADGSIKLRDGSLNNKFEKSITIQLNDVAKTRFTIPVARGASPAPASKGKSAH